MLCASACAFVVVLFPLGMLSGLEFSLVLAFWLSVGVVVRVKGFKSIVSDFKGFVRCACALVRDALTVERAQEGRTRGGIPLPYYVHAGVRAVLPLPRLIRNIVRETSAMDGNLWRIVDGEKRGLTKWVGMW